MRNSFTAKLSLHQSRCVGSLLGTAVGDILGANVEFHTRIEILQEHGQLVDFLDSPARPFGMFTDDTEMTVALAASLVSCGALDGHHCAMAYASAFIAPPRRGYGPSVSQILNMLAGGAHYRTTGRAVYPQGSFANGGAMRIAPVGLAFRNAPPDVLYRAVEVALLCTHVHPDAVDGAFIQARAISELCRWGDASDARVAELLVHLQSLARTEPMRLRIGLILEGMKQGWTDEVFLALVCTPNEFGEQFQIHAAQAVACALWAFANEWHRPEECVIRAVMLGGDTDTVGAMAGALAGALHGMQWIPNRWYQAIENGPGIGRDYLMDVGRQLGTLELHGHLGVFAYGTPCCQ
ncbi:MAG: ADP-ribosylglycohydrolase family protein [Rhodoferax sp.]